MPQQHDEPEEKIRVTSIKLVREEDVAQTRETYESISCIHIYSLQPTTLKVVETYAVVLSQSPIIVPISLNDGLSIGALKPAPASLANDLKFIS